MGRIVELLKKLSQAEGVSGFESNIADIVRNEFREVADRVWVDKMGSVIAQKKGKNKNKILLAAHLDEIGLMVTKIDKGGYIKFTTIGGFDPRILLAQEVAIHSKRKYSGVIGAKPVHFLLPEQREKVEKIEDLFIDTGLPEDEVKNNVRVGDFITIKTRFSELKGEKLASKAFDNRASVAVLVQTLHLLQGVSHPWDVYAVSTSQEEVGGIGAITSTYKIYPNVGIAIDVTQGDMPGCPEADTFPLTKGPAIAFGPNIHSQIFERLVEIANAEEIPHQIAPHPGPTATDAYFIQIAREGIPTGLVSIPLRYMHTPVETVATVDIERAARLLAKFIETIGELKL